MFPECTRHAQQDMHIASPGAENGDFSIFLPMFPQVLHVKFHSFEVVFIVELYSTKSYFIYSRGSRKRTPSGLEAEKVAATRAGRLRECVAE